MVAGHQSASFDLNNKFITEHTERNQEADLRGYICIVKRDNLVSNGPGTRHWRHCALRAAQKSIFSTGLQLNDGDN